MGRFNIGSHFEPTLKSVQRTAAFVFKALKDSLFVLAVLIAAENISYIHIKE